MDEIKIHETQEALLQGRPQVNFGLVVSGLKSPLHTIRALYIP
jgi:hypothetical protein